MPHTPRKSALALLSAIALIALLTGVASAGTADRDPSPVLTQMSLTVQPDLCVGHVTVSLSYDGGRHWESFIEAPVRGNPANCNLAELGAPYVNQASMTWTPDWSGPDQIQGGSPAAGHAAGEPGAPSDVLTLTSGPWPGSTQARIASAMPVNPHQSEAYWAQFTWNPGGWGPGSDSVELLYGASGSHTGPRPGFHHR